MFAFKTENLEPRTAKDILKKAGMTESKRLRDGLKLVHYDGRYDKDKKYATTKAVFKNSLSGIKAVTAKSNLYRVKGLPLPKSIIVPTNETVTKQMLPGNIVIVKPGDSFGGYGISMFQDVDKINAYLKAMSQKPRPPQKMIISEYIPNPRLFDGLKSHIRMYLFLGRYRQDPLKVALIKRGPIFTAARPFTLKNLSFKLYHDSRLRYTNKDRIFDGNTEAKLFDKMVKVVKTMTKVMYNIAPWKETTAGYSILGIDFLLTDNNKLYLLEVNRHTGYGANETATLKKVTSWIFTTITMFMDNRLHEQNDTFKLIM